VRLDAALRRIPTWTLVVVVPLIAVIAVVATGSESQDGGASAVAADTVDIKDFAFAPQRLSVKTGTAITVANEDGVTHTFTANDGAFDTGDVNGGRRVRVTVDRNGTFAYHCDIHPFMRGTVQVSP
jgi:plastocyanin